MATSRRRGVAVDGDAVVDTTVKVDMSMGMGGGAVVAANFTHLGITATECTGIRLKSTKHGSLRDALWQGRGVGRNTLHRVARNTITMPRQTRQRGTCRLDSSSR